MKQTTLLPAARCTLPAASFTASGQYARGSRYRQRPLTSRHEICPDVCSYKRVATSGQQAAVQLQFRNVH
jgi:hypothetical protein